MYEFADMVGISGNFMGLIERGVKPPSLETLINIADKLDISLDYIIGHKREDSKLPDEILEIIEELTTLDSRYFGIILNSIISLKNIDNKGDGK